MGGRRYLLKKLGQLALTMILIIALNFFLFRIMPSDPVAILTRTQGVELSVERQEELRIELGLDKPFPAQFVDYLGDMARGDIGESLSFPGQSVMSVFLEFLWPTLLLVGTSTVITVIVGLYLGVRGGWNRGKPGDIASMYSGLILYSMPEFWLALMLLTFFATILGWFPGGGFKSPENLTGMANVVDILNHLALPCLTLTLAYVGEYYLLMRSSLLDVLGEDYITAVRAKGIGEHRVLWRHAVRNALLPTVTLIAISFGFVLGGAITVELVFSYPGLGLLTIEAFERQDFPLLQAMFLLSSFAVLVAILISDLLYSWIDPRVRVS